MPNFCSAPRILPGANIFPDHRTIWDYWYLASADGNYWPSNIENTVDMETCDWLSEVLHLVLLAPRPVGYDPLLEKHLENKHVKELGDTGRKCYEGILAKDVKKIGESMSETFYAWRKILPYTVPGWVLEVMEILPSLYFYKILPDHTGEK